MHIGVIIRLDMFFSRTCLSIMLPCYFGFKLNAPHPSLQWNYLFFQHNLKKIRNNLMKSGNRPYHTQLLKMKGNTIIWDHWVSAFRWDIKQHSLPVHYRLTEKHIFPTTQEKMRNALAEDCLDKEMLHLMQVED